jgi:hypothetical protein
MAIETFGQVVLDGQLDAIKVNADEIGLVKNFLRTDADATTHANVIATLVIDTNNAVWGTRVNESTGGGGSADAPNRRQNVTSVVLGNATGTANGTTDDLSLCFFDGGVLLAVSDVTTNRAVSGGDSITTYVFYIQANQPVVGV